MIHIASPFYLRIQLVLLRGLPSTISTRKNLGLIDMSKIVLLLGEHPISSEVLRHLETTDHDVRVAGSAEDSIDLAYLFEPDLLITDAELEDDYTGIEVSQAFAFAFSKRIKESRTLLVSYLDEGERNRFPSGSNMIFNPQSAKEIIDAGLALLEQPLARFAFGSQLN